MTPLLIPSARVFESPLLRPDRQRHEGLLLPFLDGRQEVPFNQIVRLEGVGNYTLFVFADRSTLLVALTLKRLMARLPETMFVRAHRKHLLNLSYLDALHPTKFSVEMSNGDCLSVSRRKAPRFFRQVRYWLTPLL